MKINFNEVIQNKTLDLDLDLNKLNNEYKSDTIKSFNNLKGTIKLNKVDNILIFKIKFVTNLTLLSSYSLKEFNKDIKVEETLYFTNDKNLASEETILIDDVIDLNNLVFSLALTSIPLKVYADDEKEIKGEGYRVIKEEDLKAEKEVDSSPFDILKDLDL